MKLLKDILYKVAIQGVVGSTSSSISEVVFDSRKVSRKCLFVAVKGVQVDGHDFIEGAIKSGATAILCEKIPANIQSGITYIEVDDSAKALGVIASNYYDNPSSKLKLVGITGTNGKTTTATLLYQLFKKLGFEVGLVSTVVNKIGNEEVPATHTTPNAMALNELLNQMVEAGCDYCFMEVSSHALVQGRVAGIDFAGAVFTNITHDHLDYHKTFKEYIKAKKMLFDGLSSEAFAIVNVDDKNGAVMIQNCKANLLSYALKTGADYKAKVIENQFSGLQLNLNGNDIWVKLIGDFNAYNVLAVYAVASQLLDEELEILAAISSLDNVQGRFQYIQTPNQVIGIVDYAHTPDALENVLKTIKNIRTGNEQVITVVGCGGDRDKEKRPKMANVACRFSDRVILTSDNPRSEDPEEIINDMKKGVPPVDFKKTIAITNREEAIKTATAFAESGDIILIAGKGHETYQEIKGERFPFDDMEKLKESFKIQDK